MMYMFIYAAFFPYCTGIYFPDVFKYVSNNLVLYSEQIQPYFY